MITYNGPHLPHIRLHYFNRNVTLQYSGINYKLVFHVFDEYGVCKTVTIENELYDIHVTDNVYIMHQETGGTLMQFTIQEWFDALLHNNIMVKFNMSY